ncbi:MAG: hypothetical protein JWN78_753 [Bacteroidota bacterium]|nr:hypothetical protein [Bacteroidota bacterium]
MGKTSAMRFDREAWIPLDFDPKNTVLLIEIMSDINKKGKDAYEKENATFEKIMKENYPFPYELTTNIDTSNEKYLDRNKYAYALSFGEHFHEYAKQSDHLISGTSGATIDIFNRKDGTYSETNGWAYSYRKGILEETVRQLVKVYNERGKQ